MRMNWHGFSRLIGQCVGVCSQLVGTQVCAELSSDMRSFDMDSGGRRKWQGFHGRPCQLQQLAPMKVELVNQQAVPKAPLQCHSALVV